MCVLHYYIPLSPLGGRCYYRGRQVWLCCISSHFPPRGDSALLALRIFTVDFKTLVVVDASTELYWCRLTTRLSLFEFAAAFQTAV